MQSLISYAQLRKGDFVVMIEDKETVFLVESVKEVKNVYTVNVTDKDNGKISFTSKETKISEIALMENYKPSKVAKIPEEGLHQNGNPDLNTFTVHVMIEGKEKYTVQDNGFDKTTKKARKLIRAMNQNFTVRQMEKSNKTETEVTWSKS